MNDYEELSNEEVKVFKKYFNKSYFELISGSSVEATGINPVTGDVLFLSSGSSINLENAANTYYSEGCCNEANLPKDIKIIINKNLAIDYDVTKSMKYNLSSELTPKVKKRLEQAKELFYERDCELKPTGVRSHGYDLFDVTHLIHPLNKEHLILSRRVDTYDDGYPKDSYTYNEVLSLDELISEEREVYTPFGLLKDNTNLSFYYASCIKETKLLEGDAETCAKILKWGGVNIENEDFEKNMIKAFTETTDKCSIPWIELKLLISDIDAKLEFFRNENMDLFEEFNNTGLRLDLIRDVYIAYHGGLENIKLKPQIRLHSYIIKK